ncbi:hypothetical protein EI77_04224 [Prosthecobacter fusiformis]|uniref:Uncharacterized protein n=1 Tax=Prosthecobacter fusiformis TaxID=48464 RepID=A0A4R7RKS9_9BACT|nr:hypothetical protein [Prosthecobacter fusiformis]TDU64336.1 hypothetical protein EI77_04224 [Prosthecobacter fusiformis]
MNPKQLACVVLMMFIGLVTYFAQTVHQKVTAMKKSAAMAEQDAIAAESSRQTAEILTARVKAESEEIRRFLQAWTPYVDKAQTEQEVEGIIEFSLRERGITLVRSRKTELKVARENKIIPKSVLTTLVIEDEYAKVMNWLGDVEKRLPLARVKTCRITGGSTARQLRLDVSLETPLINLSEMPASTKSKKKA